MSHLVKCNMRAGVFEMKVKFLIGDEVASAIDSLMDEYDEFHWAVAWGTSTPLAQKLVTNSAKIRAVTFGLAFAQTDPDLVEKLVEKEGCYVVTKFPSGVFHPKVYAFRSGKRAAAIVGSANFTHGGLDKNHEACVLVKGSAQDKMFADTFSFTARSASVGERVTKELEERYRLACERAARKPGPPRDPLAGVPPASVKSLSSNLVRWDWEKYVSKVKASNHYDINEPLALLRTAQAWLSGAPSFRHLSELERKAIAGIIGDKEKLASKELNQRWGWFGKMGGFGVFKKLVAENDPSLARAVDSIPQKGEVTREHFARFSRQFKKAFANSRRVGGVATASRLLAMKRPDVFLCISKPNIAKAAIDMGFAKTTLNLDNYWNKVVEVTRASDWYNFDKPKARNGQIWECRAAMLDAIFYDPEE